MSLDEDKIDRHDRKVPPVGKRMVPFDLVIAAILAAPGNIGYDFRERMANHVIQVIDSDPANG